jgi:nitrate/nitrite transporter NarK
MLILLFRNDIACRLNGHTTGRAVAENTVRAIVGYCLKSSAGVAGSVSMYGGLGTSRLLLTPSCLIRALYVNSCENICIMLSNTYVYPRAYVWHDNEIEQTRGGHRKFSHNQAIFYCAYEQP